MKKLICLMLAIILSSAAILVMLPSEAKADAASGGEYNFKEADYNVVVNAPDNYVNFRYGPGLEYGIDCRIYNGASLHISRTADNMYDGLKWGQTYYQGRWGWVSLSQTSRTGWVKSSGKWYYYDSYGTMKTGWVKVKGKWYYLNSSGVMQTGWVKVKNKWYYLNSKGVMQTGWVWIGSKQYHFNSSGVWDQ